MPAIVHPRPCSVDELVEHVLIAQPRRGRRADEDALVILRSERVMVSVSVLSHTAHETYGADEARGAQEGDEMPVADEFC